MFNTIHTLVLPKLEPYEAKLKIGEEAFKAQERQNHHLENRTVEMKKSLFQFKHLDPT